MIFPRKLVNFQQGINFFNFFFDENVLPMFILSAGENRFTPGEILNTAGEVVLHCHGQLLISLNKVHDIISSLCNGCVRCFLSASE
jgi:hypothetical protein